MNTAYTWFLFSILSFAAEALGANGIGLLFAAIAAFLVGLLLQLGLLDASDHITQWVAFFGLTGLSALLLWKPLQAFRMNRNAERHQDIVGRTATVAQTPLGKDATGTVLWSGTLMSARLAEDAAFDNAAVGTELKIVRVDGATLVLAQTDYPLETG